jgi:conjugal transfer pilus assembly protein TraU
MSRGRHLRAWAATLAAVFATAPSMAGDSLTCTGRFPNPITDICWSCILPITLGGTTLANLDGQEDIANPSSPVCSCGVNPTVGLSIGFWEPARHVETPASMRRPPPASRGRRATVTVAASTRRTST